MGLSLEPRTLMFRVSLHGFPLCQTISASPPFQHRSGRTSGLVLAKNSPPKRREKREPQRYKDKNMYIVPANYNPATARYKAVKYSIYTFTKCILCHWVGCYEILTHVRPYWMPRCSGSTWFLVLYWHKIWRSCDSFFSPTFCCWYKKKEITEEFYLLAEGARTGM